LENKPPPLNNENDFFPCEPHESHVSHVLQPSWADARAPTKPHVRNAVAAIESKCFMNRSLL